MSIGELALYFGLGLIFGYLFALLLDRFKR